MECGINESDGILCTQSRAGSQGSATDRGPMILRRDFLRFCLATGIALAGPACAPGKSEDVLRVGDIPPSVILSDLKGNSFALPSAFKGKVALVHFWASWCTSCRPEMIALESLYGTYRNAAVVPCSINVGERKEAAESYLKGMKVTYPILLDQTSSVARQYNVSGIPTIYVLNRECVIKHRILGEINREGLERIVRTLIG